MSVYCESITLEADRASNASITVQLMLKDLKGIIVRVSDIFKKTMSRGSTLNLLARYSRP